MYTDKSWDCTELTCLHVMHLAVVDAETLYRNMPAQSARTGMWHMTHAENCTATYPHRAHAHICCIQSSHVQGNMPTKETATCPYRARAQACYIRSSMHNCNVPVQSARTGMLQIELLHIWSPNPKCYMTAPGSPACPLQTQTPDSQARSSHIPPHVRTARTRRQVVCMATRHIAKMYRHHLHRRHTCACCGNERCQ